jgi:hypothetical protein
MELIITETENLYLKSAGLVVGRRYHAELSLAATQARNTTASFPNPWTDSFCLYELNVFDLVAETVLLYKRF